MPKLTIDGIEVQAQVGSTILDAAKIIGMEIPTMCFLGGHPAQTSCMVCVVKIVGSSRLVPACATRAEDGMVVENSSDEVTSARRTALELLLGDHLGDCIGPCQSVCPAHMDIPAMIQHISRGDYRNAIATVKRHIAIPAVLGRICPELCEKACRRSVQDKPVSICLIKRFIADWDLASDDPYMPECKPSSGKRVAIVGAGPAGLSAAYYLLQDGHACVIFDDHPSPGGMLRYGVPVERLPHSVLDAEIKSIMRLGAEFRPSAKVENAAALDELCRKFDAVLLATGKMDAESARNLGLIMGGHGLHVDNVIMMTSKPGVFAAGSAVSPSHLAARAVEGGRHAAAAISRHLEDKSLDSWHRPYSVHIGHLLEGEVSVLIDGVSRSDRVTPAASGFDEAEARAESARCLHCECAKQDSCKLRDYGIKYDAHPTRFRGDRRRLSREVSVASVVYEPGKCISCGLCVQLTAEAGEPLGLTFLGRGFNVRPGVPFTEPLSKALAKVADECCRACPTGALVMTEEVQSGEAE